MMKKNILVKRAANVAIAASMIVAGGMTSFANQTDTSTTDSVSGTESKDSVEEDQRSNDEIKEDNAQTEEANLDIGSDTVTEAKPDEGTDTTTLEDTDAVAEVTTDDAQSSNSEIAEDNESKVQENEKQTDISDPELKAPDTFDEKAPDSNASDKEYNQQVDTYNQQVDNYNGQTEDYNKKTDDYNKDVAANNEATEKKTEETIKNNDETVQNNSNQIEANNETIEGTVAQQTKREDIPEKPELEDLSGLSEEKKNDALKKYDELVEAYNGAVKDYNENTLKTYQDAIDTYNKAIQNTLDKTVSDNHAAEDVNNKALEDLNKQRENDNLDKIEMPNDTETLSKDMSALTPESQNEAVKEYNTAVQNYNDFIESGNFKEALKTYEEAIKNYNQQLLNKVNNTTVMSENNNKIGDVLELLKVIKKTDEDLTKLKDLKEPEKPNLSNLSYEDAVNKVKEYNEFVAEYNQLVAGVDGNEGFNSKIEQYNKDIQENAQKIAEENKNLADQNEKEASGDVSSLDTSLKINNANAEKILKNAVNQKWLVDEYQIDTYSKAQEKFKELTDTVNQFESAMSEALEKLSASNVESADYENARNSYNDAVQKCIDAIEAYNKFIQKCNPVSKDIPDASEMEKKEYQKAELYKDTYDKGGEIGTSEARYFIQIEGTVPLESANTAYPSKNYVQVGTGTIQNATTYKEYLDQHSDSDKVDVRNEYNRIDVPASYNIVSKNEYNNQQINLDHLGITDENGKQLGTDATLTEKLRAYYGNIYDVLLDGAPTAATVIEKMHKSGKLDQATYEAYKKSVELGTPAMDVIWYVVKDSKTGTSNDKVHVDGALYFINTGIIYDSSKFVALTTQFNILANIPSGNLQKLSTLEKIDDLKEAKSFNTLEKINVASMKNASQLKQLENLNTVDGRYAQKLNTLETLKHLDHVKEKQDDDVHVVVPPIGDSTDPQVIVVPSNHGGSGGSSSGGGSGSSGSTLGHGAAGNVSGGPGVTTQIADINVPLASLPESMGGSADLSDSIMINDGIVPLAALPKTGQKTSPMTVLFTVSSSLLAALTVFSRKEEDNQ